ncbi:uncharacterized protein [Salminus brasiliensis]|uniref:uncharacterized protein isoform X2 n=1 Tax=Salminus brasiliensis TaxID=930266 RepID=UPI003B832B4E
MALQWGLLGVILLISGQISVSTAQANVCKTFGSGVIQTFNKSMFYLKSTCPFTLTRFTLSGVDCGITVQRNATGLMSRVEISVNKITTILQDGKVTVEGNSISLPFDHTYQLVYQYGVFIKLRSKVLPFSVIWRSHPDSISSLWVQLDHELLDGMTGICGRLNGAEAPAQLISASVMSDGKCVTEDAKPQKSQVCEVLSYAVGCLGGKSALNTYIDLCSRMPSNVHTYAKCAFFEEIARMCGNQSSLWSVWRGKTSCPPPTCPGEMKYHELGPAFPPTCTNPQPPSGPLISTCLPPSGMVLNDRADGFLCINIQECPCVHGGKTYPPGAKRNSKCQSCVCVQGKWNCSANVCPPTCNMEGRFVTTFDGKQYRVPGKCTYVAASGPSWTVTVRYSDTDASIAEMHLDVSKDKYTFSTNSVKRGQDEITDLSQTDHTMVFWQSSMFVQVQTYFGMKIKVQVSPEIQLYLYLPPSEQTRGLCGIYNNDTEDDFTTSSGIVENAVLPFTQSWTIGQCSPPNTDLCVNTDNEIFAEQKCSQLRNTSSAFARCHDYVPVSSFFDACVQRTCKCTSGVQNCLCVALSNYAKACAGQGIDVGDWRAESACSVTCNGNLRFRYIMSACNHTCRSLTGPDPTCDAVVDPVEGCGCLVGTHLKTPQECSSSALCMCHYQGGTTPPGPVVIDGRQCLCENGVLHCSEACDCPQGKICVHCAQAAVNTSRRTCESLSKPSSVEETCSSGCYCPAGLIENHSGGCVTQDNCTCEFSGSVYASGQTVVTNCKKCTCRAGQWHCEGEPCPGVCEVFGNGQYNTFDSKWYRFDGNCQYTLVEDDHGLFAVRVESVPCCDEALTCSRSISVDLQDVVTLTLRDMNVTQTLKAGWHLQAKPLYSVHTVGLYIIISVPDLGLTVIWDKHTRIKIVLQARWKGNVRGLCGNFDGVVTNDLLTRSSSLVFSTLEFGNSWKTAVPPCSDVTQEVFPCERHSYCEAWAQRRCMILLGDTFTDCRLKVDPAPYYQACILESCSCEFEGRFLGFCTAVAAYAEACTAQKVCINWRTPDLCPVYCDYYNEERENGWHYEPCGRIKTCGKTHSFTGSLEGCYPRCPVEAPYFDENTRKCSSLDRCTCFFNNTVVNPGDEVRTSSECCECIGGHLICENCVFTTTQTTRSTSQPITQPHTTIPYTPGTTTSAKTKAIPDTTVQTDFTTLTTTTPKTTMSTTERPNTTLTTTPPVTTITPTTDRPNTTEPTTLPETSETSFTEIFSTTGQAETIISAMTTTTTTKRPNTTEPTTPPETPFTEIFTTTGQPDTTTSPVTTTTTTQRPNTTEPTTLPETPFTDIFPTTGQPDTTTSPVTTKTPTTERPSTTEPTTPPETPFTEIFTTTGQPDTTTSPVTTTTTTQRPNTTEPTTLPETPFTEIFPTTGQPDTTTSPVTTKTPTTERPSTTEPTTPPETPFTEIFPTTGQPDTTTSPVTTFTPTTERPNTTEPTTPPETPFTEIFTTTGQPDTTTSPVTTKTPTTERPSTTEPTTLPETPFTEIFPTTGQPETTTSPVTTKTPTTERPSTTEPTTLPETPFTEIFTTTGQPDTTTPPVTVTEIFSTTGQPETTAIPVTTVTPTTERPSTTEPTTPPVTVTETFSPTEEPEPTTSPVTVTETFSPTEEPEPTTPPVTVTETFSPTEEPEPTTSPVTVTETFIPTEEPEPTTPPVTATETYSPTEEPEPTTPPVTTITTTMERPNTTETTTPPVTLFTETFSTTGQPDTTTSPVTVTEIFSTTEEPEPTTTSPVTTVTITTTERPSTTILTTPLTTTSPVTTVTITTTERPSTTILTTPLTTTSPVTTVNITTTTEIPSTTTTPPVITGPTLIVSTSHQHTEICRDPLRNQSWSSGAMWTEDCFHKTCKNSIIEMRPVICPALAPPVCPRDLMRVVKDEQGCCETWQCDCQCDLYGDPHYVSFSGTNFDFLDNCTYTLVKEKNPRHQLSITVDNYFSNPWLFGSSVKGIILKYHNDTVTLRVNDDYERVEAFLNQIPVQPPYKQNGIRFESTNYQVFVYLDQIRSHVSLDPENTLQITLAMEYFLNNTVGQCGVCGGPSCVRRNGQVESEDCCERTAYDWIEEDPLKPYCSHAPRNEPCTPPPSTPAPICNAPLCDLLTHKVFRECSQSVDVETLLKNCRSDYCIVKTNSSICSSLRHLSEQCQRLGVCVHWRNLTMGICDVPCPEGMVFDECRSTPNDVCKGGVRVSGKFGTDSMRSGCFCPNNQSLAEEYKTKCVSECTNADFSFAELSGKLNND